MSVNATIGRVRCPFTGEWAEVRKDKKGKLYFLSSAGLIRPNMPPGQEWILSNAEMFEKPRDGEPLKFGRRILPEKKLQSEIRVKEKPAKVSEEVDLTPDDDDDWLPW